MLINKNEVFQSSENHSAKVTQNIYCDKICCVCDYLKSSALIRTTKMFSYGVI